MTKSSQSILHLLHTVKSTVKISSIFVVFLENTNFKEIRSAYVLRFYKAFLRDFFVGKIGQCDLVYQIFFCA